MDQTNFKLEDLIWRALDRNETISESINSESHPYRKEQKERIARAAVNQSNEIFSRMPSIGNRLSRACLAIATGCHWGQLENLARTDSATASALWMRDELMHVSFPADRMHEILEEGTAYTARNRVPASTEIFHPGESLRALSGINSNRITKRAYHYSVDDEKRLGQSHELYEELKSSIPDERIREAKDIFIDRLLAYLEAEMKIAKLCLLKVPGDVEEFIVNGEAASDRTQMLSPLTLPKDPEVLLNENGNNPISLIYQTASILIVLPFVAAGVLEEVPAWLSGDLQGKITGIIREFDPLHTSDGKPVDPYIAMAGFLFLRDEDSDWSYLAGPCDALLELYLDMLPWRSEGREWLEEEAKLPDWCRKADSMFARNIWIEDEAGGMYVSPAQIIYNQSHIILADEDAVCMSKLDAFAKPTTEDSARLMADTMKLMAVKAKLAEDYYAKPADPEPDVPEEKASDECERLQAEIAVLRKELKNTKASLEKSEHEKSACEKAIEKAQNENKALRQELAAARESADRSDQDTGEALDDVSHKFNFPYTVRKKTVVFGGQESWRHAMNAKVQNLTFAPMTKRVNSNFIHTAEVIWIQPNAFSHCAFRTLSDIAKKNGIPIYFFGTGGATRCAEQLADVDFYGDDDDYNFRGLAYGCS